MKIKLLIFILFITAFASAQEVFSEKFLLMGSDFEITVVASDRDQGNSYINAAIKEISRIEKLISSWDSKSQTSATK